jgi:hypothetical protein
MGGMMALDIQHRVGRSGVNARNNCTLFAGGGVEVVREAGIVARGRRRGLQHTGAVVTL